MSAHAIIYKPNEHADEYIVFVDDVKEVSELVDVERRSTKDDR